MNEPLNKTDIPGDAKCACGPEVVKDAKSEAAVKFEMIVTIIPKGSADVVVDAAKAAGAEGATIINGRGTGIHEHAKLFGMPVEPQKDIVITIVPAYLTDKVLAWITSSAELDKPGKGIAFVLDIRKTAGICHLCSELLNP